MNKTEKTKKLHFSLLIQKKNYKKSQGRTFFSILLDMVLNEKFMDLIMSI